MSRNMTQSELATVIGLTRTSVTNIEKGRQKLLVHSLFEIAAALGISPVKLIEDGDSKSIINFEIMIPDTVNAEHRALIESAIAPAKNEGQ